MKSDIYNLTFITPCFCAGANQSVAEVRSPSIRGKLRWWFRVLGGTPDQEAEIFGATAGDSARASAIIVRVADALVQRQWQPIEFSPMSHTGYVLYFAKKSANGARWKVGGALPQGAQFQLQLLWKGSAAAQTRELFDLALDAFLMLGSFGLRSTRGLGCFETAERPFTEAVFKKLLGRMQVRAPRFIAGLGQFKGRQTGIIDGLGSQLRGLRAGYSAGPPGRSSPTPLGSSQPRQTSAVHLRPVKVGQEDYRIVVFEAPADKVLGLPSRRGAPRLGAGIPQPGEVPQRGGSGQRDYRR
jgi:CRISPR type III-B/RAMP module RAMP protein Cmr1